MTLKIGNRVRQTTTTTGTGTVTLIAPATGFNSFASEIGDANTCPYLIDDGAGNWELGIGTVSSAGPTLTRTTVLKSSNANALVNFPAGIKTVSCQLAAELVAWVYSTAPLLLGQLKVQATKADQDDLQIVLASAALPNRRLSLGYDEDDARCVVNAYNAGVGSLPLFIRATFMELSAGQITFPLPQNPSSNTNTLDDYEEGLFTPTLGDGTNNYTLSTAAGFYTKIGDIVVASVHCIWTSIGSAGAGQLRIGGVPFASLITFGNDAGFSFSQLEGVDTAGGANHITGANTPNSTSIFFRTCADNAAGASLAANSSSATGVIKGTIVYKAAN